MCLTSVQQLSRLSGMESLVALDETPRHPIRVAARRAGLTPTLLRAWERRYGAVNPGRSEGGQRLYSDRDIHRLTLLRRVVEAGRTIGRVVELSNHDLEDLAREDQHSTARVREEATGSGASVESLRASALRAVATMDERDFHGILMRGAVTFSAPVVLDDVVVPVLREIGERWQRGSMGPAQEHLASAVVRDFLSWLVEMSGGGPGAPTMVVSTPRGHSHELGALLAAAAAAAEGWDVVYAGSNLPADQIAAVARQKDAEAIAVSALYPDDDPGLLGEIAHLREGVGPETLIAIGGAAAARVRDALQEAGAEFFPDLASFRVAIRGPDSTRGGPSRH